MKKLFRVRASILTLMAATVLMACGNTEGNNADTSSDGSAASSTDSINSDLPYIGIMQLTTHPALDQIGEGIIDQLEEAGYVDGETATIDFQNAQGDQSNMQSIAERFVSNDADIMIGIATPAAQALANASSDIPIILGAITDPVAACLVQSMEKPGGNITGVSDKTPARDQFILIQQLLPDAKTVGILYSSAEDNSISSAKEAEEIAASLGLKTVTKTVTSTNDIAQVAESLASEVDAIYVPTDNTIASGLATLIPVADAYNIPVFPAVDTMVEEGGLATIGLNQYALGTQTGAVAADILDGADPATYPVQYATGIQLVINRAKAEQLGIAIPDDIAQNAIFVGEGE